MGLPPLLYEPILIRALEEDLGRAGDVTTAAIVPRGCAATARVVAREPGTLAGVELAARVFTLLSPDLRVELRVEDGGVVEGGAVVATVTGPAGPILTGERTALNFLGHLSGIATATAGLVQALQPYRARVVSTRKTTPGLRALEKEAVRLGGGAHHRFGLDDGVLIKDNHLALAGGVREAVARVRAAVGHLMKVEVEVESLEQLGDALAAGVDAVLLDNMPPAQLREAVAMAGGRLVTEASGRITPATAPEVAATGVDLLSAGYLTHSAPGLDFGLDL